MSHGQPPQADAPEAHEAHEGPIKTPKQLIVAVVLSFVVPIIVIVLLINYVASASKTGAGSDSLDAEAVARRIQPIGAVVFKDMSAGTVLKTGQEVFTERCAGCHQAGVMGAPKLGDAGAWAPRLAQGFQALVRSALVGKNAMPAQGGADLSDIEIARGVAYLANQSGGKFDEPKAPAASAPAP